jgi:hypothetical protein
VRPRDRQLAERLNNVLVSFDQNQRRLHGIQNPQRRLVLVEQLLESIHRVNYVSVIRRRPISNRRGDPVDELFDPLGAAILQQQLGNLDEAFWLVFLFVHFGKSARGGWRYAREVYGRLGMGGRWDWASVSRDPAAFRAWLDAHQHTLRRPDVPGGFGNHRKYQSLGAYSRTGTGAAVQSYVEWVNPPRTHVQLMNNVCAFAGNDPQQAFDHLYRSMSAVTSFGRMGRFDYLTMVGKLQLVPIEPGLAYLKDSTGPLDGAKLLVGGRRRLTTPELETVLVDLNRQLNVGMQVIEDALCNWQKSPRRFIGFRG